MIDQNTYTLVNKESGELAFKLHKFESISQFDHIQRPNYYSLVWIQKGSGNTTIDFNTYEYGAQQLFSFTPYQPFMFEATTKTKGVVIHFHPDFFCIYKHQSEVACNGILFNNIYDFPFVEVNEAAQQTFTMLVESIKKDIMAKQMAMTASVLSYLQLFLITGSRLKDEQKKETTIGMPTNNAIAQELKDLIEEHYKTKHAPKEYAAILHMTPKNLAKISKQYFNKTLTTLIAERVIIEAKRELYLTNKSVKEVALELGYEDEFYFSRFFKKQTNTTPSFFRKTVGYNKIGA